MPKLVRMFSLFLVNDTRLRSNFKNSYFLFHRRFQTLENNKKHSVGRYLRPRAFISFLVFGNLSETLALVVEILPATLIVWCPSNAI